MESTRTDRRPVRIAVVLAVIAAVLLADAAMAFAQLSGFDAAADALRALDGNADIGNVRLVFVFNAVAGAVGGLLFAVLALAAYRRRRPARGAALTGALALGATVLIGLSLDGTSALDPERSTPAAERAAIEALISPWYGPAHSVLAGLTLIGMAVSAVLLFRFSSIDFYD